MKKLLNKKIFYIILIIIFTASTIFFGYKVIKEVKTGKESMKVYGDLKSYVSLPTDLSEADNNETLTDNFKVDFPVIKNINTDCVAWLYIGDTNINYPVLQGSDNNYYLKHSIDRKPNKAGSIFLDYRVDTDISERNSVIYGHNMKNGTMFRDLTKYKKQSYYNEHKVGFLITPEHTYRIQFFSGYVANVNDNAWKLEFADEEDFSVWIESIKGKSSFLSDVSPMVTDRVVTLSTCSYEFENARYILHGILSVV